MFSQKSDVPGLDDKFVQEGTKPEPSQHESEQQKKTVNIKSIVMKKETVAKPKKTAAELAFERARAARLLKQLKSQKANATSSKQIHKEAVKAFNARLGKQSDHYDIPKVGPG